MLATSGLYTITRDDLESDDILASLARHLACKVILGTRDKDLAQCVTDRVHMYWPTEKQVITAKEVEKTYGVPPNKIRDYLTLLGDAVDNIPGVPGVAKKTALKILTPWPSLQDAIKSDPEIKAKLLPHRDKIKLARKLIKLDDTDLGVTLDDLVIKRPDLIELKKMVWKTPESLNSIQDMTRMAKTKGLFR